MNESTHGSAGLRAKLTLAIQQWDEAGGLSPRGLLIAFALVLLALFSRMPSLFLHPQFYAEDGAVWYSQAYNLHWLRSLEVQQAGYLQTLPRLVVGVVLFFPMLWAPLLMNLAGAIVQALPVTALLSRRCSTWGPMHLRLLMAVAYVGIPNVPEIHIVLTNSMWHLVVLQLFIAFGTPPRTTLARISDFILFFIGAISGPFCMLMIVPVALHWWLRRERRTLVILAVMFVGSIIQAILVHLHPRAPGMPLGAGLVPFMRLLGGSIFTGAMAGLHVRAPFRPVPVLLIATLGGLTVIAWGLQRAPLALRLYALFAAITLAASLKDPLIYGPLPRWSLLAYDVGCRYWFYPALLFLWSAIWCFLRKDFPLARYAGSAVLLVLICGMARNWSYGHWPNSQYSLYVERFQHAKHGEEVIIPIYPEGWKVDLIKR